MPIIIENIESYTGALSAFKGALESDDMEQAFRQVAEAGVAIAQGYAPEYEGPEREGVYFEKGHLKSQINARSGRDVATGAPWATVGAPWYIGGFLEYGTEHNGAFPFMRPAADDLEPQVEGTISGAIGGLFE